jgi:hypothetical protein
VRIEQARKIFSSLFSIVYDCLFRAQIGLHVVGAPQWFISCAQITITGGGSANPSKVSIPGYVSPNGVVEYI